MYRNSGRISKKFRFRPEPMMNKILLKTALFPNCFKLFHELIQLTKTVSDYGEEIKVFRQFLEEVCFFFLHICFRIRRTAFLNKQMTEVMSEISSQLFFRERKCRIAQSKFRSGSGRNWKSSSGSGRNSKTHSGTSLILRHIKLVNLHICDFHAHCETLS